MFRKEDKIENEAAKGSAIDETSTNGSFAEAENANRSAGKEESKKDKSAKSKSSKSKSEGLKKAKAKMKGMLSGRAFRHGSFGFGLCVIVIAIVVVLNMIVNLLPESIKNLDMSSTKIYSIGEVTEGVVDALDQDVRIHIIAEEDDIDDRILKFVQKYVDLSDHLSYDIIDPVLYPSTLSEYNTSANTIVVECEGTNKQTTIDFDDIIVYDQTSYYYYGTKTETEFDGEGQLTSAVDYVTNDNSKTLYTLEGHNEASLGTTVTDLLNKQNFSISSVNLMTDGAIPDDCDLLLINAATSDLAADEATMIQNYIDIGGKVVILLGDTDDTLTNLRSLMAHYGITQVDGYVADAERFYQQNMFYIFPEFSSGTDITSDFASDDLVLLTYARGLQITDPADDTISTTEFMTTSDNGYLINGEEQTQGTYVIGALAEKAVETDSTDDADAEDTSDDGSDTASADDAAAADSTDSDTTDIDSTDSDTASANSTDIDSADSTVSDSSGDAASTAAAADDADDTDSVTITDGTDASEDTTQTEKLDDFGTLTVISADSLINDNILQSFPSLVNSTVFMNSITSNFSDVSTISIEAKSLEVSYNTVTNPGSIGLIFIAIIPLAFLVVGFIHWMRRRKA